MFSRNLFIVLQYVRFEKAIGPYPSLFAIEDRLAAPVTASPIHTGLFIPTPFRPAFTISSFAVPIPIPAFIVGYFFHLKVYSTSLDRYLQKKLSGCIQIYHLL